MFKGKRVLVTGGAGMIGRELVKMLLERGAIVSIADMSHVDIENVKSFRADLRDFEACKFVCRPSAEEKVDYVFNLVGIKCSPKVCLERPADIMGPMLQFNTNMLEAAMWASVDWYLYTSTVGVYHPDEVLREDDVWITYPSRNDWYGGWAKRMGELQCQAYEKQYGKGICSIVRPANVYGKYDNFDPESAMVIPSLIRKAFENKKLEVWGDGSAIRDFIHARDVARGMLFAVENKITEPINLGSGNGVSIKEIANSIAKYANKEIVWDTSKPKGDHRRVFDTSRAKKYGFEPKISIDDGIKETIEWYLDNKGIIDERYDALKKK
mgnify:CR=1 FL=1